MESARSGFQQRMFHFGGGAYNRNHSVAMTADRGPLELEPESVLRFDLAVQRNRLLAYFAALLTSLTGRALGVFTLGVGAMFAFWIVSSALIVAFYFLYRAGVRREILNPLWIASDLVFITIGVYVTGGYTSPWYLWYLAPASGAAFVIGKRAAYITGIANAVSYLGLLIWMGQAWTWNDIMLLGLTRMVFLFGASFFFLTGAANLAEKRLRIRQLEAEEKQQIEDLTRLAQELKKRTDELADANRKIQEADRLKSQFLANMSHELRTPMNSIIGFSEILVERLQDRVDGKHLNFLRHILASGQHLLGIINDILDLSKIEAGRMEIYPEFFTIAPVVDSVCHVMRGMSKARPHFVIDIPPDLPQIETDLAKFKQVLFNLLSNAVKFSPADKPITISASFDGNGWITMAVKDEGIGIDPAHHEVVFEEFRQVDGTARREFGGTGLGLALVKKFVELQGGRVAVDSSPGKGSRFTFSLPVRSRAAVVTRTPDLEDEATARPADRVLVVEDDAHAYELLTAALASAGYLAIRARHGEEAIRLARETHPIAITLDLVLPGLDGWEVLKQLKNDSVTCEIPVVIISLVDNRELGLALGADDYFVKPVDRDRLLQRIREITSLAPRSTRPKLLLIDDDASVHALLDEELARLGYAIEGAYSGEEGLRAAGELVPDLIILDLMMPGMSGFEVATGLKDNPQTANIPILVLTSKDLTNADRNELQSKVTSFVQKGKSAREQLVREIRRLGERRGVASSP
jgi:signal transduction histidine kinase/DNA-binding response OmpR family regulator